MNVAAKWLSLVRDSLDSAVPRLVWDRGGKEGFVSGYSLGWTGGMFEIFQSSSCGVLLVALLSRWHVRNLVNRIAFLIGSDSIWNVLIIHGQAKGLAVSFFWHLLGPSPLTDVTDSARHPSSGMKQIMADCVAPSFPCFPQTGAE